MGYSRKSIELYINNVNVGESEKPDVFTAYLGPYGDLESYIKIDKFGIIKNGKFHYVGCPASASVSAVIELIKGKPINEVKKLTEHDILNKMGGLPKEEIDFVTCNIYSKK